MNIFVYEFITSGGLINQPLPTSLAHEGELMFRAVVNDLLEIAGINISCTRDHRLDQELLPVSVTSISTGSNHDVVLQQHLQAADAAIIIAPETAGQLANLIDLAQACDCQVLGCNRQAVDIAGSKLKTHELLQSKAIATPYTQRISSGWTEAEQDVGYPCVLKPDDGVGAEHCYLLKDANALKCRLRQHGLTGHWLVQEYITGEHASVTLLCYQRQYMILAINQQVLDFSKSEIKLTDIRVNGFYDKLHLIESMVADVLTALPGLAGFIGIDCIINQSKSYLVDINPRLTTAYAGLADSIGFNPMRYLIELFRSRSLPKHQHQHQQHRVIDIVLSP